MAEASYRVLACDGGGIRGVITARLLQALDPSVLDNIDLFAGTSTGSIIALGLASGVPIDTIVELYSSQECCSQIFQPYLPAVEQDRVGQALATSEEALAATLEAPRTSGTGCASWGRFCCSRSTAAPGCASSWPAIFPT